MLTAALLAGDKTAVRHAGRFYPTCDDLVTLL
jgi:hypothetical protein